MDHCAQRFLMSLRDKEKRKNFQLSNQIQGEAVMKAKTEKLTLRWCATRPFKREKYTEETDEAVATETLVKAIQIQLLTVDL